MYKESLKSGLQKPEPDRRLICPVDSSLQENDRNRTIPIFPQLNDCEFIPMELGAAGLSEQPFPTHGKPLAIIPYQSQRAALDMLRNTLDHPNGLSLLQGPALSGKSVLIRTFIESLDRDPRVNELVREAAQWATRQLRKT